MEKKVVPKIYGILAEHLAKAEKEIIDLAVNADTNEVKRFISGSIEIRGDIEITITFPQTDQQAVYHAYMMFVPEGKFKKTLAEEALKRPLMPEG